MTHDDNEYTAVPAGGGLDAAGMARARYLIELERWDRALAELHGVLAQDPDAVDAHYLTGLCHYHLNQYTPARQAAERAVALAPMFDRAHWLLSLIASQRNRTKEAFAHIETALELDSEDPLYHATQGALLVDANRPREGLAAAERALAIDPNHEMGGRIRTMALSSLGKHGDADAQSRALLSQDPDSAITWYFHGQQLLSQGKADEAKQAYLESLRLDPEDTDAQEGLLRAMAVKHPFFTLFWRWSFFLQRFTSGVRWVIIIGLYLLMQLLKHIARANPTLLPVVGPIAGLYFLFCVYTWIAQPLFRLAIKKRWIR